ncbi:MAG TPA: nucleotide exchange factor GrpE [Burkholderiaceae bacterium]|nr:nucleotide exchange factor GrpE [Burkholderiaceae bacterium]
MQGPELNPAADKNAQQPSAANEPTALSSESTSEVQAELQTALDEARAKASEHYDLYVRARAEIENTRRRAQDDISKAHKYAVESFAEELVPVMDSLEKALEAVSAANGSMREGIEITLRQLRSAFEKNRLTEIDPKGQKFDPHKHQAVSMVPADGVPPNHVAAVLQKGWMIADRVLRPALVTVAQA